MTLTACGTSDQETQSLEEQVDYTVIATEPGAGLTTLSHQTIEEYDNLNGWFLQESSTAGMLAELEQAINNEEPVIVTAWTPHWIFDEYDLKILEDPKQTLGGSEEIRTIARLGFESELPSAYQILDNFYWEVEDMQAVMKEAQDIPFEEAADNWIQENSGTVDEWTAGVDQGNGEMIELVSTPWDTERASSFVVKQVLEDHGFEVTLTDVEPAVMFQSIASGSSDVSVAPWLPSTHQAFYENYEGQFVDMGPNLEGTLNGFVVPAYVEIDSIEDLQPKN